MIPEQRNVSIEREVFPALVDDGLYGLRLDGYWMDIGTPDRYLEASWDIIEGRVETAVSKDGGGVFVSPLAEVADGARIGPRAVIGDGCTIAAGARVSESVLLDDCRVGENAAVSASIFSSGVTVAPDAVVGKQVLGKNEQIDA